MTLCNCLNIIRGLLILMMVGVGIVVLLKKTEED